MTVKEKRMLIKKVSDEMVRANNALVTANKALKAILSAAIKGNQVDAQENTLISKLGTAKNAAQAALDRAIELVDEMNDY